MSSDFSVTVGAGTLRDDMQADVTFPHQRTDAGVAVTTAADAREIRELVVWSMTLPRSLARYAPPPR